MVSKVWNFVKLSQMNIYQINKNVQDKLLAGVKVFSKSYKKTKGKKWLKIMTVFTKMKILICRWC